MNTLLIHEKKLLAFMREIGFPDNYLGHVKQVTKIALDLADKLLNKGMVLDINAIYFGAMLHDLGRAKVTGIRHGIEGAILLEEHRLFFIKQFEISENTFDLIKEALECHIAGGIPVGWIKEYDLDLPVRNFVPESNEAKLISLCDQQVHEIDTHEAIFREAPAKAPEIFERLYLNWKYFNKILYR